MGNSVDILNSIDAMLTDAVKKGLIHRTAEDTVLSGTTIRLDGTDLLNFSSCSYLGLEVDPRLKEAAIKATEKYGVHFSSSRAYLSAPIYNEIEEIISQSLSRPSLMATTCLLGDLSALPILITDS